MAVLVDSFNFTMTFVDAEHLTNVSYSGIMYDMRVSTKVKAILAISNHYTIIHRELLEQITVLKVWHHKPVWVCSNDLMC